MSILRAYLMPHPPLAVPSVGKGSELAISATVAAYKEASGEIAGIAPDTVIFITPHNVIYSDYFHISPGDGAEGDMSRFGADEEKFKTEYDAALVSLISSLAEKDGVRAGTLGEKNAALDHGAAVPMWFINGSYTNYKTVRISQSGFDALEHYRLGKIIAKAAERSERRAVLIASGDLSHKLNGSGSYGFAPEGAAFDKLITEALADGDFGGLLDMPENIREKAAECGYNSAAVLAGCFDGRRVTARLLSYEGPFGVGYAVMSFAPGEPDRNRCFYMKQTEKRLAAARAARNGEDAYQALARQSLEYAVYNGKVLEPPDNLPDEMTENFAGVFVSVHKNGRLRGCVGTVTPSMQSVAKEIIINAISAGMYDDRFEPVTSDELPFLTYKVDVLSAPEKISGIGELDVKRYGVIVSSGGKRGLLLPGLDGVDTPEQQTAIARRKGGIDENEPVTLERFEVVRHESPVRIP